MLEREFIIKIDHKLLKYLLEQRLYIEAQHNWLLKLHNYKFIVENKKGKEIIVVDSVSRKADTEEASFLTIIAVESGWLEQLRAMVNSQEFLKDLTLAQKPNHFLF